MRRFKVTCIISGYTNNFDNVDNNGLCVLYENGNKNSSEQSIIRKAQRECSLCGCKLEKVIEVEEVF